MTASLLRRARALPYLGLILILNLFLVYLAWIRPWGYFGLYHDDTLYFSSAQALAEGRGYVLPSVPGAPASKYPVLYPWLLSWIWRFQPSFPANVVPAVWLTALFGCWFVVASFLYLRRLAGMGEWAALACAALCAFHPFYLFLSGAVLSDVPFLALALTAALVADSALARASGSLPMAAAGLLAGLSLLTRSAGLPVVAGIVLAALYRRAWRRGLVFVLAVLPFLAAGLFGSASPAPETAADTVAWRQTWAWYTSYWDYWRTNVPDAAALIGLLKFNLKDLLLAPASFCLFSPLGGENSYAGVLLSITLSAGILAGIARQARGQWTPLHFALPACGLMLLLLNFALMDRYLLLFLPLFYAGLWIEGKHLASMLAGAWRRPGAEKVLASVFCLALLALAGGAVAHYLGGFRRKLPVLGARYSAGTSDKAQAYQWVRLHAGKDARLIAYEDVSLYLYTRRQAMRPIAFSTDASSSALERDLAHITDVARRIGASYWLMADNDFHLDRRHPRMYERLAQLRDVLPLVFRSEQGKVQLYDLSCLARPEQPACQRALPVLFPAGYPSP